MKRPATRLAIDFETLRAEWEPALSEEGAIE